MHTDHRPVHMPTRSQHAFKVLKAPREEANLSDGVCGLSAEAAMLRALLWDLVTGADLLQVCTPSRAQLGLLDLGRRLQHGAQNLICRQDNGPPFALATDPASLWYSAMAEALAQGTEETTQNAIAYLCGFANDALPEALVLRAPTIWRKAGILRAENGFEGNFSAAGPYLVLMRCTVYGGSEVTVDKGFILPVLDTCYIMPVNSGLERETCMTILKTLEALASGGVAGRITRLSGIEDNTSRYCLEIKHRDGKSRKAEFVCSSIGSGRNPALADRFTVTRSAVKDGSLAAWLKHFLVM